MPRGPTRRLRHLLDQAPGTDPRRFVTTLGLPTIAERLPAALTLDELLDQAAHEAALLRHPYIGPEHVQLAAAARVPDRALYDRLRNELLERAASWLGSRWRPRGPRSAARRRGQRDLDAEQRRAQRRADDRQPPPDESP